MQSRVFRLLALTTFSLGLANAVAIAPENLVKEPGVATTNPLRGNGKPSVQQSQTNAQDNGNLETEGKSSYDGVSTEAIPEGMSPAKLMAAAIAPAPGWTAVADNEQPGYPASNVLDNNVNTFWHTQWGANGAGFPHQIVIDMKEIKQAVNQVAMIPRQDGQLNGNIGEHIIDTSVDGINWNKPSVIGTYADSAATKTTFFEAVNCRYVRLRAYTEAGGRGPWTSMASLNIFQANGLEQPSAVQWYGEWSPTIDFPLVPVAIALLYNTGKVLAFSAYAASTFIGGNGGNTMTATFDPVTRKVSQRNIQNTDHDMFCPGLSMTADGKFIATGGNNAAKTSLYDPGTDQWSAQSVMNTPRGYQSDTILSNGNHFTIGGSWSGGDNYLKNAEVFNPSTNVWTRIDNAAVQPMLTKDQQGQFRADNHAWLFGWKGGSVFQAGPSRQMNWYGTGGTGSVQNAGNRGIDGDAMCGMAVMYDAAAGKILTLGGAVNYQGSDATANAHIITINAPGVPIGVQTINTMWFKRIFASAVVLPSGQVFVTGGQVYGNPFSDDTAILQPEIWDPVSYNFVKLQPQTVPRTYHSTAILLADATVLVGGGGLCGDCATNHYDAQVFTPPYLFQANGQLAVRPQIVNAPAVAYVTTPASNLVVTADGQGYKWSFIRLGSSTHTVNTDQRRIPLFGPVQGAGNRWTYSLSLPTDPGIMLPGYYMLFAINPAGVPSLSKFVRVPIP